MILADLITAAGANRLAVVYPNAKLIQLWNLETFAKERIAPLPASMNRLPGIGCRGNEGCRSGGIGRRASLRG